MDLEEAVRPSSSYEGQSRPMKTTAMKTSFCVYTHIHAKDAAAEATVLEAKVHARLRGTAAWAGHTSG